MEKDEYKTYIELNENVLSFIGYMVDNYGLVVGLEQNYPKSEELARKHHDYIYFCITKATRSLLAANELAKIGFREDVMTIVRSIYETYLLLGNALNDIKFINKSIMISLGLREKLYTHPVINGKINYKKVKFKNSEKIIDYDMSKSFLSRNTFCYIDNILHNELYKYMSEHIHSEFIGSGNYRVCNNKKYSVEPCSSYLETIFVITYMSFLLLQSIEKYHKDFDVEFLDSLYPKEIIEISILENTLINKLNLLLDEMEFAEKSKYIKNKFKNRINYKLN